MAAYCEPRGRVLAVVLIHRSQSVYHLVLQRSLEQEIARRLQIYVLRSSVNIVAGAGTVDVYGFSSSETVPGSWAYPVDDSRRMCFADTGKSPPAQTGALTSEQWKLADINSGLVWLDSSTSSQFLPQALNLVSLGTIDFNKGCYPGQEIIARSHYLGSVKRKLIRVKIPESKCLLTGQELFFLAEDKKETLAGHVVAVATDSEKSVILAVIKTAACEHKLIYYVNDNKLQTARISDQNKLS